MRLISIWTFCACGLLALPALGEGFQGQVRSRAKRELGTPAQGFNVGVAFAPYEYSEPGLMSISGQMYGLLVSKEWDLGAPNWTTRLEFDYFSSMNMQYDGALISLEDGSRTPKQSESRDFFTNIRWLFGNLTHQDLRNDFSVYMGLGFRYLGNRISGTGSYRREQTYLYIPLKADYGYRLNRASRIYTSFEFDLFISGLNRSHLEDVNASAPTLEFEQNSGYGLRAAGGMEFLLKNSSRVRIEGFARYWNIEDSSRVFLLTTDNDLYTFFEPANETLMYGLSASMTF